jgi:hypothetical protein
MIQLIGILIIVNCFIATGWLMINSKPYNIWLCVAAILAGLLLIISERIVEISYKGFGIKAVTEKAILDAKQISDIRTRIENQGATVDLVAKQALEVKKVSDELVQKNIEAGRKLSSIEEVLQKAMKTNDELGLLSNYTMNVIAAQNNDRKSFDQLRAWSQDKTYFLSSNAGKAYKKIMDEHSPAMYSSDFKIPWNNHIDPTKLSLQDLKKIYYNSAYLKPAILEFIWKKRNDISKQDKMQLLAEVLQSDNDLTAVEYAGRYFNEGAGLNYKPLAVEQLLEWWENNKEKAQ